jgi:hypothetical protein
MALRTASDSGRPPALDEADGTGAFAQIADRILRSLEKVGG